MGRPLFSKSYSTLAVRTEPEPTVEATSTVYAKWTHPSDFDPDSDEFFEREDAVYEAFLDPADVARLRTEAETAVAGTTRTDSARVIEMSERLDEFIVRVAREDSSSSYSSSSSDEGTISGRGSPMVVGTDDRFVMGSGVDANIYAALRDAGWTPPVASRPVNARVTAREVHEQLSQASPHRSLSTSPYQGRGFIPPPPSPPPMQTEVEEEQLPPTRPVTPPHQLIAAHHTPSSMYELPSPAPTVTPRLYSWSSRTPFGRAATVPSPTPVYRAHQSPLTNPGARMSFAQISPAPVRVTLN